MQFEELHGFRLQALEFLPREFWCLGLCGLGMNEGSEGGIEVRRAGGPEGRTERRSSHGCVELLAQTEIVERFSAASEIGFLQHNIRRHN